MKKKKVPATDKSCVLAEKIIAAIKWVDGTVIDCVKQVA
jgi:citrate lyase alpha subunit